MAKNADDLSVLEQRILFALVRLNPDGYGVTVQQYIEKSTSRNVSLGSIYTVIDRLEQKGFVEAHEGEPLPERGGRRKVHFIVTGTGRRALAEAVAVIDRMRDGLPEEALA